MIFVNGNFVDGRPESYYGGRNERGIFEYLYRFPDGTWHLHTVNVVAMVPPTVEEITDERAVAWLITACGAEDRAAQEGKHDADLRLVPHGCVSREDHYLAGAMQFVCPPPIGNHVVKQIPRASRTWDAIAQRRSRFLQPGLVLQVVLWPAAADVEQTGEFREQRHDPLITRLQGILEDRLLERPRLSILQSLQDRGVDLLIEWPQRGKYGVQLKSHGDVEENDFASHTLAQIQDSRQHGLEKLYVVIAADIRDVRKGTRLDNSNSQKVRGLVSRISAMNDPYVVVVPPERAWALLLGA